MKKAKLMLAALVLGLIFIVALVLFNGQNQPKGIATETPAPTVELQKQQQRRNQKGGWVLVERHSGEHVSPTAGFPPCFWNKETDAIVCWDMEKESVVEFTQHNPSPSDPAPDNTTRGYYSERWHCGIDRIVADGKVLAVDGLKPFQCASSGVSTPHGVFATTEIWANSEWVDIGTVVYHNDAITLYRTRNSDESAIGKIDGLDVIEKEVEGDLEQSYAPSFWWSGWYYVNEQGVLLNNSRPIINSYAMHGVIVQDGRMIVVGDGVVQNEQQRHVVLNGKVLDITYCQFQAKIGLPCVYRYYYDNQQVVLIDGTTWEVWKWVGE